MPVPGQRTPKKYQPKSKPPMRMVDPIRGKGGKPTKAGAKAIPHADRPYVAPSPVSTGSSVGKAITQTAKKEKKKVKRAKKSAAQDSAQVRRANKVVKEKLTDMRKKTALKLLLDGPFEKGADAPHTFEDGSTRDSQATARENFYTEPTKFARGNMTSVAEELAKELGVKKPKLHYNDKTPRRADGVNASAYAYHGSDDIYINPGQAEQAQWKQAHQKDAGFYSVLAHEMKHLGQSHLAPSWYNEGDAVAYQQGEGEKALKKMGVKGKLRYMQSPTYQKYHKAFKQSQAAKRRFAKSKKKI